MTLMGHSRPNWAVCAMSGLPPLATGERTLLEVRFVPKSDIDVTTIRLSYGDRKLKQSTVRFVPGRPQPSSVIFDD
jgi:hypothetical protein